MTDVAVRPLTKDETTEIVSRVNEMLKTVINSSRQIALLLHRCRENGGAAALGYVTWDAFVKAEFGISRAHGYRLLDFAQVAAELEAAVGLSTNVSRETLTEREARDLKPGLAKTVRAVKRAAASLPADAPPEQRAEVLRETLDRRAADVRVQKPAAVAPQQPPAPEPAEAERTPAVAVSDVPAAVSDVRTAVAVTTAPTPGQPARWRELLGDDLAARVAAHSPTDPAAWCVKVVKAAVVEAERAAKERAKPKKRGPACPHPDNRRSPNGRCKDCGEVAGVVFRSAAAR